MNPFTPRNVLIMFAVPVLIVLIMVTSIWDSPAQPDELTRAALVAILGTLVVVGVATAISTRWAEQKTKTRINTVLENLEHIVAGFPLHEPVAGTDAIAYLDRAVHRMAGELKTIAQKERAGVDTSFDVVCSINREGKFTAASPPAVELFGYEPEQLIGKELRDLVVAEDAEETRREIDKFMAGSSISSFENRIRTKGGPVVDIKWSARWSPREGALYWIAHNVTDRKNAERLRREFVAMVSHDLRTPLMSVQASLSLLSVGACGDLSDKAKFNVTDAERNIAYVINLINGLLDVEKMAAGKLELKLSKVNVGALLKRASELVRPMANARQIELVIPEVSLSIVADEERLTQVLVNLISNAVKFSERTGKVTVEASRVDNELEVRIVDSGPGIDESEQAELFERFSQSENNKSSRGGSGLGLAICKAIVEEHKGSIGVTSRRGEGSIFWFKLPTEDSQC